jgi:hypothetical protein
MVPEKCKPVVGYEQIYLVTTDGKILAIKKNCKERVQFINVAGYYRVCLSVQGKNKHFYTHRLMAEAFIPNPLKKPQVNHKNGIKTDNRIENLEWATISENGKHAYKIGLCKPSIGEISGSSKITNEIALEIVNSDLTPMELAKKFNLTRPTIYRVKKGESWTHITNVKYTRKRISHPNH